MLSHLVQLLSPYQSSIAPPPSLVSVHIMLFESEPRYACIMKTFVLLVLFPKRQHVTAANILQILYSTQEFISAEGKQKCDIHCASSPSVTPVRKVSENTHKLRVFESYVINSGSLP